MNEKGDSYIDFESQASYDAIIGGSGSQIEEGEPDVAERGEIGAPLVGGSGDEAAAAKKTPVSSAKEEVKKPFVFQTDVLKPDNVPGLNFRNLPEYESSSDEEEVGKAHGEKGEND